MNHWFTADSHFGHANIIRFQDRPFDTVERMDNELVARWNEVVSDEDWVYHLGDFTLGGIRLAKHYLRQLKGNILFVAADWHHDKRWIRTWPKLTTNSGHRVIYLGPVHSLNKLAPVPIILSHWPFAEWDRKHHGSIHLHGHSHCKHSGMGAIMDVGVDCNDYAPVPLEYILDRFGHGAGKVDARAAT